MSEKNWAIGIDLGGTNIRAAHVDEDGNIQNTESLATNVDGGVKGIQDQIVTLTNKLNQQPSQKPVSLGIGVAGQVNETTGSVRYAPNLNWHDITLDSNLEERLDMPVTVLNDVRAAAWGEWLHGAGKNCSDMICIFIGTGVGGSIVSGGEMLSGASNMAGEIGHMTVLLDGPECHCGNKGCLEALCGSWAIERDAKKALKESEGKETLIQEIAGTSIDEVKAKHVINAYRQGDKIAHQIIERLIHSLAGGLTGLTNALNPARIIMGGGVTEHVPNLITKVEKKVCNWVLEAAADPLQLIPTELQGDSGVIGAAAYTFRKEQRKSG